MGCVDWCDARAYCEWAGKRLCAGLGGREEPPDPREGDPGSSEWQFACTNGGTTAYPYGAQYIAGKCVDKRSSSAIVSPPRPACTGPGCAVGAQSETADRRIGSVGSRQCTGTSEPFNRIFDLSGGLLEWTATCDEKEQNCVVQGSSFAQDPAACAEGGTAYGRETHPAVGFRCCADPSA